MASREQRNERAAGLRRSGTWVGNPSVTVGFGKQNNLLIAVL